MIHEREDLVQLMRELVSFIKSFVDYFMRSFWLYFIFAFIIWLLFSGTLISVIEIIAERLLEDFSFTSPFVFVAIIVLFWFSLYYYVCKRLNKK